MTQCLTAAIFAVLLILTTSTVHAGPLADRVREVTRSEQSRFVVNQTVLTMADLAVLGYASNLVTLYRPQYQKIRVKQDDVLRLESLNDEYRRILSRVEVGELTVADSVAKKRLIEEARQTLGALEEERVTLSAAIRSAQDPVPANAQKVANRQTEIYMETIAQRARIEALEKLELAANPSVAEDTIRAKMAATSAELKQAKSDLQSLKGSFIGRFSKGSIRFLATSLGLIAVVDVGARFYVIFLEETDPGVFPALEIAAESADSARPMWREAKATMKEIIKSCQEFGSYASRLWDGVGK